MDNFQNAFRVGIEAAQSVGRKKAEITEILAKFSRSLEVQTGGKLFAETRQSKGGGLSEFLGGFTTKGQISPWGLYVTSKADPSQTVQIAGWQQSADGYPCWLTTSGQEVACLDAAGLEQELVRLAKSPKMGAAVLALTGMG